MPSVALAVAIAAAALAWTFGPAEQGYFDSAFYVDGARHLARGEGYVSAYVELAAQEYQPITHWAPGTSLMMAPWVALGVPPLKAAAIVVGSCYVGAALLIFLLGVALAGERAWPLCLLASGLYALHPKVLVWLDAVLSDLPWASFALFSVYLGLRVMRAPAPGVALRCAWGLSLWWLVLVRYAGLLFIPALLAAVVLGARWPGPIWKRPLWLWPVLLTAAPGIGLWNLRNKLVADRPLGGWQFVHSDIHTHFSRAVRSTLIWVDDAIHAAAPLGLEAPLRWLLIACAVSLVPLTVVSVRSAWRQLALVIMAGGGYFVALAFAASVTMIATLGETRFWIVIWPLTWLAMVLVVSRAQPRWCLVFKPVVIAALVSVVAVYAHQAYRGAPAARQRRALLHQAWAQAAEALPEPDSCYLLVNDPRPFMLHRELPPMSPIPLTLDDFKVAEARAGRALCLVTTAPTKRLRLSSSAERRRRNQNEVVDALKAQNRLTRTVRRAGVTVYRLE